MTPRPAPRSATRHSPSPLQRACSLVGHGFSRGHNQTSRPSLLCILQPVSTGFPRYRLQPFAQLCACLLPLVLLSCSSNPPRTSPALLRAPTIESSEPWSFESAEGRLIRTRHYRLFTTDTSLRETLPPFLERALHHYTTSLTTSPLPTPDLKLDTFLMATRPQWESLTRQVMGIHAAPYLRIQRGGFASGGRALLFTIGPRDTLAIAAHEGWHQYTQRTFKHELPLWLEEGLAAWMEGFLPDVSDPALPTFKPWANPERFEQLVTAAKSNRLIPLTQLLEMPPDSLLSSTTDYALTYYAQTWALAHYLHTYHPEALSRVLRDAASGSLRTTIDARHGPGASQLLTRERRGTELFTTYFSDLPTAQQNYEAFLAAVTSGSKDRISAGLPPHE